MSGKLSIWEVLRFPHASQMAVHSYAMVRARYWRPRFAVAVRGSYRTLAQAAGQARPGRASHRQEGPPFASTVCYDAGVLTAWLRFGVPAVATVVVAFAWGLVIANTGAPTVWVGAFVLTSLLAGTLTTWWLGRRTATEIEDALSSGMAAAIIAALLPIIPLVVMLSGAE